jgi:hypothetical protein
LRTTDTDANGDTYGYAYGITDSNAYGDANTDANADSYSHADGSRYGDTNAHLHTCMAKRAAYDHCTAQSSHSGSGF